MLTDPFYEQLPELGGFEEIFSAENYYSAPEDWVIIVTDVVHSTQAIEVGMYKQVNIAGAVAVAVIANMLGNLRFPFTFGGDGMTALLPPNEAERAVEHLLDLRRTIHASFGLEMRVAAVAAGDVAREGYPIRIAKLRVSAKYTQAVFDGPGIARAEDLVKSGRVALPHENGRRPGAKAQTAGFSCRWREIPSGLGEVAALIVEARGGSDRDREQAVREVFHAIRDSLGTEERYHPVAAGTQRAIAALQQVDNEARIHARGRTGLKLALQRLWVYIQLAAVHAAVRWNIPLRYHNKTLSEIPADNVTHADFRKYDGRLKMVLACTTDGRRVLQRRLDEMEAAGRIVYGLHTTDHALITCIMHLRAPDEVHFIDGGDGGYTLAAAQLKHKLVTS